MITHIIMIINTSFVVHSPFYSSIGSVGSKAQGGQPSAAVYNSSVAPVVSQGSGSYSHSAAATTAAPYTTDSSTDYSQYNQAYTQVLPYNTCTCVHTHTHKYECWILGSVHSVSVNRHYWASNMLLMHVLLSRWMDTQSAAGWVQQRQDEL